MSSGKYPFTNLVFSGGGVRGCGYTKLWSVFEEYGIAPQIKRTVGVSAGAIIAGLIALGLSGLEIEIAVRNMKLSKFADNSFGIALDIYRLFSRFGWNRGDAFTKWFGAIVAQRFGDPNATLKQVYDVTGIEFNAGVTCLELEQGKIINYKTDPDLPFCKLVRMSMSIPGFFLPVIYQNRTYVDGGLVNNYPIWYVDSDETLGFRLIGKSRSQAIESQVTESIESIEPQVTDSDSSIWQRLFGNTEDVNKISNIKQYVSSIISTFTRTIEISAIRQGYWERTVKIDTDVMGSTDFDPDPELMELVISNGEKALREYLDSYEPKL